MIKRIICGFVVCCCVMATGCTEENPEEVKLTEPSPTPTVMETEAPPRTGGTLRLTMRAPKTLNPLLNEDATVDAILKLIFEPMFAFDASQKPVPNLVGATFAADGMSVLLTVREGAMWSDGRVMRPEDIQFSLDMLRDAPDTVLYKGVMKNISGYALVDERSLRINYIQPYVGSSYQLSFPIIPEHYYRGESDPQSVKNMSPIGSGLYKYDSYINMKEMNLSVNTNGYRKRPYIEKISVMISPDLESDLYALDQSIVDLVSADISDWSRYRSGKDTNITEYVTSYYDFIGFNFKRDTFMDRRLRAAVAHSLDMKELMESVYLNHAVQTTSPISPVSWVYERETDEYEYNLEEARALMIRVGYYQNSEGTLVKTENGEPKELEMEILVNEENTERVKIANALKEALEENGVRVVLTSVSFDQYEQKLKNGEFDLFVGGYYLSVIPDLTFAFHSSQIDEGANYFSYKDDTMDSLLGQVFTSTNDIQFAKAASDLQKRFASELPCISLVFRKTAVLSDENIGGEIRPVYNNIYSNINEWYSKGGK